LVGLGGGEGARVKDRLDRDYFSILDLIPGTEERRYGLCSEVIEHAYVVSVDKNLFYRVLACLLLHHADEFIRVAKCFPRRAFNMDVVAEVLSGRGPIVMVQPFEIG
jgi:hypothetical protein